MKRFLSILIAAVMLVGLFPAVISGGDLKGSEKGNEGSQGIELPAIPIPGPGTGITEDGTFEVIAYGGTITVKSGSAVNGKYKEGSVITISFNASAFSGKEFDHWTSASGEKISAQSFSLLVDQNAYFFPVFKTIHSLNLIII